MAKIAIKAPTSIAELDRQEHLTDKRLFELSQTVVAAGNFFTNRPKDGFLELMNWAEAGCKAHLNQRDKQFNRFVHNKIIIDGQFLYFCEEQKITVKPILKDSFVSWKSDHGNEKFFMQGIFLITQGNTQFIHCALFLKGNQNEDEISFFVLVDNDNFNSYTRIRNEYDEWCLKRDRSNLQIRVIDSEDIPYEQNMKWDDVFLPDDLKSNIKLSIEGFLKSKSVYDERKIPWKRGMLFWGAAGNGKSTLIKTIISNYDFKPITLLPGANDEAMSDAFAYAEEQNPALLFFEDLDSLLQNINISLFLNLLDGISTKNGLLVIATANSLDNLKANIKDRPSRFDRKFEIPLPDEVMSLKYIKKWFEGLIDDKEAKKIATFVSEHNFSYAYIKELYISSVYNAIADNREKISINDINSALTQLMADKFKKNHKTIGIDKYIEKKSIKDK